METRHGMQWELAATASACLAVLSLLARPVRRRRLARAAAFAGEAAVVLGLFAIWQVARSLAVTRVNGAVAHARWIWHVERIVGMPSELRIQHAALTHPLLVEGLNGYYALAHFPGLIIFLVWLFIRHRDRYPSTRIVVVLVTGASLLIQMIPVAPPRLVGNLGFIDTALLYGQSVYGAHGNGIADQLSAMPSVHVAWAVLVALVVVQAGTSRWRWLVIFHPVMTVIAVVATGNHFWLDGIAAVVLLALAVQAQRAVLAVASRCSTQPRHGAGGGVQEPARLPG